MTEKFAVSVRATSGAALGGIAAVSAALLMTELALTRIFSVTMYYHFAFMAISIALFGLSASGVYVFLMRDRWRGMATEDLLRAHVPALNLLGAPGAIVAAAVLGAIAAVSFGGTPRRVLVRIAVLLAAVLGLAV